MNEEMFEELLEVIDARVAIRIEEALDRDPSCEQSYFELIKQKFIDTFFTGGGA